MRKGYLRIWCLLVLFLLSIGTISCGGVDYQLPSDVFVAPASEQTIVEAELDGVSFLLYDGELLVQMKEDSPASSREEMLRTLGAKIIGQVPAIGMYQLQVNERGAEALATLVQRAYTLTDVVEASLHIPTLVNQTQTPPYCERKDDNHASTGNNACAWRELLYNETLMILEKLKGAITYHPVRVGVIDSGVQGSIGQFDDIQLVNLNAPSEPLTDVMGHGTSVAALIGADNKDGGINGLTSRFIGNKLTIFASSKGIRPFKAKTASGSEYETVGVAPFQTIAAIYLLGAAAKADVVNISLGLHGSLPLNLKKGTVIFNTTKFGLMYRYVLQRFDKTLFVISAGNEDTPIVDYNAAWFGGGKLANVLTVGATAHCAPTQRASFSNYGSLVDISAPGEQVPALAYWKKPVSGTFTQNAPGGAPYNVNGTSFSAPIVSAIAALLKSIQPSLTTTQLVQYLKDNAYPASTQIGGMRANMLAPVVSLVLDNYPGGLVSEVLRDENGLKKSLSIVAAELCGGSKIEVKGKGTYLFDPKKDAFDGTWLNSLLTVSLSQNDASYTLRFRGNPEVGKSYPLVTADQFDEGKSSMGTFVFNKVVGTSGFIGNGVGGSLKVENCKITDRSTTGGSGTVSVLANITFKGQMEVVEVPSGETTQKDITGTLTVGLFVPALDATLQAFFEKHCK